MAIISEKISVEISNGNFYTGFLVVSLFGVEFLSCFTAFNETFDQMMLDEFELV
jgi:hypothetical protein